MIIQILQKFIEVTGAKYKKHRMTKKTSFSKE